MAWYGLLIGAGCGWGVTSGRFAEWSGFKPKNQQRDSSHQSQSQQHQQESLVPQPPQPPQVIVYESPNARSSRSWMYSLSGTALLALAGYYYYIHKWGTKKVISRVEETAEETQNLVDKADKNNSKRFSELDARNTERAHTLEAEIRSETRAGFGMLSEQIYGLTQICIETLSAIAHGGSASIELNDDQFNSNDNEAGNNQNEFGRATVNENLLQYSERAQQMADTIISPQTLMTKKAGHLQDIRAEIYQRNPVQTGSHQQEYVTPGGDTPGGPSDMNGSGNNNIPRGINNVFDMDANQKPWLSNISYKDNEHNLNELDENNKSKNKGKKKGSKKNSKDGIMGYILNNEYISKYIPFNGEMNKYFKIVKIGNEIKENAEPIFVGLAATVIVSFAGYSFFTYKENSNRMSPIVGYDPNANGNYMQNYNTNDNRIRQ